MKRGIRVRHAVAVIACAGLALPAVALAQFPKKYELPAVGKITYCTSKADRLFVTNDGGDVNYTVAGYAEETGQHPSAEALSCSAAVAVVKADKKATINTAAAVGKTEKVDATTYRLEWKLDVAGDVFAWSGGGVAYFFYEY